jgi:2,4-dienoyl-CoA reductase-like NADH-dependent reductase (Old Yellow Enzyme family)
MVGVRLSVFDTLPFEAGDDVGRPVQFDRSQPYEYGFGVDVNDPHRIDLSEPIRLIHQLKDLGVVSINVSCGSPYYNPHVQRPAIFPPIDGYQPPEDPLEGVVRQIHACRDCQLAIPELPMVGTGYSYLQDFLPHVAQATVRNGWCSFVGIGRMALAYPCLPADTLSKGALQRKLICRTFSDCTTAPRSGLISGCYPLDDYYKQLESAEQLREIKQRN